MRVVFDTNVLVAAVRSRNGASFALVSRLPNPQFTLALSVGLYAEWCDVLSRPEHLPPGRSKEDSQAFLRYLASVSHLQAVFYLWRPFLRDPEDDRVLECAVASSSRFLVTHNLRDFEGAESFGVQPISPLNFLNHVRSLP